MELEWSEKKRNQVGLLGIYCRRPHAGGMRCHLRDVVVEMAAETRAQPLLTLGN